MEDMMAEFRVGDRVRRVTNSTTWAPIGFETEVVLYDKEALSYIDRDGDVVELVERQWQLVTTTTTPTLTPLDDAGRTALKKGDRVLVEAVVSPRDRDDASETTIEVEGWPLTKNVTVMNAAIYARLPDAPKPVAVGDRVRRRSDRYEGRAIATSVDGRWVVERFLDDVSYVMLCDASDLEVIS